MCWQRGGGEGVSWSSDAGAEWEEREVADCLRGGEGGVCVEDGVVGLGCVSWERMRWGEEMGMGMNREGNGREERGRTGIVAVGRGLCC